MKRLYAVCSVPRPVVESQCNKPVERDSCCGVFCLETYRADSELQELISTTISVPKHICSSTVFKYNFQALVLYEFILLLQKAKKMLYILLHYIYFWHLELLVT